MIIAYNQYIIIIAANAQPKNTDVVRSIEVAISLEAIPILCIKTKLLKHLRTITTYPPIYFFFSCTVVLTRYA